MNFESEKRYKIIKTEGNLYFILTNRFFTQSEVNRLRRDLKGLSPNLIVTYMEDKYFQEGLEWGNIDYIEEIEYQ